MTSRGHGDVVLVPDEAKVIRVSELIARMGDRSLREIATEIGVPHSTIHRFLRENGYEPANGWRKVEPVGQQEGS